MNTSQHCVSGPTQELRALVRDNLGRSDQVDRSCSMFLERLGQAAPEALETGEDSLDCELGQNAVGLVVASSLDHNAADSLAVGIADDYCIQIVAAADIAEIGCIAGPDWVAGTAGVDNTAVGLVDIAADTGTDNAAENAAVLSAPF